MFKKILYNINYIIRYIIIQVLNGSAVDGTTAFDAIAQESKKATIANLKNKKLQINVSDGNIK